MTHDEAQELSAKIVERFRRRVLKRLGAGEKAIEAEYKKAARYLSVVIAGDEDIKEIRRVILAQLRMVLGKIAPLIEEAVNSSAGLGHEAAAAQARKIFGKAFEQSFKDTKSDAFEAAAKRIRGSVYRERVTLSGRIWRNHAKVGDKMALEIKRSIRAERSIVQTADELLQIAKPELKVPQYIERMREAVMRIPAEDRASVDRVINQYARRLRGPRNEYTVRVQTEQFLKELRTAKKQNIEKVVARWTEERARKHARMVARHETVEAYKDSYRRSIENQPFVKGIQWTLAAGHEPDECDLLAYQNLYGLGPGGYPIDKVPKTPHPNDKCTQVAIVDVDHFKRLRAERKGLPEPPKPWEQAEKQTAAQWLQKQPADVHHKILGPTRAKAFKKKPTAVITGQGGIVKVNEL